MNTDRVREVIAEFLQRAEKPYDGMTDSTSLHGDGLKLDSLETAELSALLEDELGSDPFSTGETMPETVGDVIAFYNGAATA